MTPRFLLPLALTAAVLAASPLPFPLAAAEIRDWRWVQGTVFVPTTAVNEAQQWDEYDPVVNDRELHYASIYGINVVRVYLHYDIFLKKRSALLADIEDFLTRADHYGIKTEFVFFDDCWNEPPADLLSPAYHYPAPLYGVHNSRWLVSPGANVQQHYAEHRSRLKAYVQDIVRAHLADPRVLFWETYNEPKKAPETERLEKDALAWIKETGSSIPVTATGQEFSGGPYSDFKSWHEYGDYKIHGDQYALCTECMNRKGQSVPGIVEHYRGKTGYIFWEFGIGRDNCRFAWSDKPDKPRRDEPKVPFHGIVYPDGHPWSLDDARALLGAQGLARARFFTVKYYRDETFHRLAKTSVTPAIDFDLGDERGTGSPDASAGVPATHFSTQWTGTLLAPASGSYLFSADGDGRIQIIVDGKPIIAKETPDRGEATGTLDLQGQRTYPVLVRYAHGTGSASLHFDWSGPNFAKTPVEPSSHFD